MMQSDTEPKFCKDCKHYLQAMDLSPVIACLHPRNMGEPELVHGRSWPMSSNADLRKPDAICGPDGAMFEAKPPEPPPEPKPPVLESRLLEITEKQRRGLWDLFRF